MYIVLAVFILLLVLSLLNIVQAKTRLMWLLSVLSTEWGYFFSPLVLAIGAWLTFWSGTFGYFILALFAAVAYILPLYHALRIALNIKQDVEKAFGQFKNALPKFKISFYKLIVGRALPKIFPVKISYKEGLTMDIYTTSPNSTKVRPCVVVVHGGAWDSGNSLQLPELNRHLAGEGYVVAAINYSLAPANVFPAPVEDVGAAVTFLKDNAHQYGIDINCFFLLGRSAGGQIVQVAGYQLNDSAIKGVIAFYSPADLVWGYANPGNKWVLDSKRVLEGYMGGVYDQRKDQYHQATLSEIMRRSGPPMLMLHGRHDVLVAFGHNTRLIPYLEKYRNAYYLLDLPWAVHGFDYHFNGLGGQLSTYAIEAFLKRYGE